MNVPCAVICGRPNVGKSTLFNRLIGRRVSIVEETRGVTRDRVTESVSEEDMTFELVDTGGMGVNDVDGLTDEVERQITIGLERADVIVLIVDAMDGLLPDDETIAIRLREMGKPIVLVANKAESTEGGASIGDFYRLGLGEPIRASALHGMGKGEILDAIKKAMPEGLIGQIEPVEMKLAIVGRRNVGKSTFVNAMAGEDRMIVSEVAGTTRDAVDVRFEKDGKTFIAIDTAGVRKKSRMSSSIEFYSFVRAKKSIERADVVVLLLDVSSKIVDLDRRLAREISDQLKPCVIVANKWDLAKGQIETGDYADYLETQMPLLGYAPITFMTAKTGRRVMPTIELAQQLYKQAHQRAPTAIVNQALTAAVRKRGPKPAKSRIAKFFYGTQVSVAPPTIVIFVNDPALVPRAYQRYLANAMREALEFPEVPVKLLFRARSKVTVRRPRSS
ncbi:ribosome biogenesis GTPase Der [bacterium]|nr:ribosome biogenesis GTPase Der [bacterium]